MNSIPHSGRYLPHTIDTRYYSVKLYRGGYSVNFVCRKYHISKASLMRWNKRFDGTKDSLRDKSHRPINHHPNAHTEMELKWINDLHRRNPHISIWEMYGKLHSQRVHPFDRFCERIGTEHKLIRPRTPWHNGKVERSHRNDQERFYNFLSFYSFKEPIHASFKPDPDGCTRLDIARWETLTTRSIAPLSNTLSLTLVKPFQWYHTPFLFLRFWFHIID